MAPDPPPDDGLPPAERARVRHRDRKRETRMVVDNAGVRRLLPALRERRRRSGEDAGPPPRQGSAPGA